MCAYAGVLVSTRVPQFDAEKFFSLCLAVFAVMPGCLLCKQLNATLVMPGCLLCKRLNATLVSCPNNVPTVVHADMCVLASLFHFLSGCVCVCPPACLPVSLSVCVFLCLSIHPSVCHSLLADHFTGRFGPSGDSVNGGNAICQLRARGSLCCI